jgi:hypothetical protein
VELENFSFTFIDAEDYKASEKWQIIFLHVLIFELFLNVNVAQR